VEPKITKQTAQPSVPAQQPQFKLPLNVAGRADIMRILREINSLNDFFAGTAARPAGASQTPPKTTRALEQLATLNELNMLNAPHRKWLAEALESLVQQAPSIHISFATEPTPRSVEPIVQWLRENIHPLCLVQTGVAPAIAAGCILRTPNKMFDMGMRVFLQKQSHLLNELIAGAVDD
jgi:hypothetical protein